MSRSFKVTIPEITLPKFEVPWPDGAAIANSLKSRIPDRKSASKLPMLLGVAVVILVLVILAIGAKKMCGNSSRKVHTVETEPDGTSVVTDSEES
jgi:flagellar biosynthesis/type III secretory pathway M-ring protein FliF/YscJ